MYYSETKVVMGGLAHVPILIFIVNLIKGKFAAISEKVKLAEVSGNEPEPKVIEVRGYEAITENLEESEVKNATE